MGKIHVLDTFTANRIAAGEVVDKPASVVKELVENSIDAGATAITVEIKAGGVALIRVTDNGSGIEADDCLVAFERHATSKIYKPDDIDSIITLGFRGEALSSIAAVSQVELTTRARGEDEGTFVKVHAGKVLENRSAGCPEGTTILVENLFFNTPARLNFLSKPASETGYITDYISRLIMAKPAVAFKFISNDKQIFQNRGRGDLLAALFSVYGRNELYTIARVGHTENDIRVEGYISHTEGAKPNRKYQSFYVNGRYVQSARMSEVVREGFGQRLMVGKHPLCAIHITMPYDAVDVNVHPNKLEVRFKDEANVMLALLHAVQNSLGERRPVTWANHIVSKPELKQPPMVYHASTDPNAEKPKRPPEQSLLESPGVSKIHHLTESEIEDTDIRNYTVLTRDIHVISDKLKQKITDFDTLNKLPLFEKQDDPVTIVGQAFSTYILATQGESMYIIDQHAAHERILYDRFLANEKCIGSQQLLKPIQVMLTGTEIRAMAANEDEIRRLGFEFTWMMSGRAAVTAVPMNYEGKDAIAYMKEALSALDDSYGDTTPESKRNALATMACRAAIKGNSPLSEKEIQSLLAQMDELHQLYCPHGRPVIIRLTRYEIEKLFGRA